MAHEVRGVVARGKREPVAIETVVVPDPGPGWRGCWAAVSWPAWGPPC
jgi:hypothetical protein